jgi:hypothetical protein
MSFKNLIHFRERIFSRSCLESAPFKGPRTFRPPFETIRNGGRQPQLYQLKQKLLHMALEKTADAALAMQICGVANRAAELAWDTACPLLVFPCLFEEMSQAVQIRFQEAQSRCIGAEFPPTLVEIDPGLNGNHPNFEWLNPISRIESLPALFTPLETQ